MRKKVLQRSNEKNNMIANVYDRAGFFVTNTAEQFGIPANEAKRFTKFIVVGGIGFVVDFTVFNIGRLILLAIFTDVYKTEIVGVAQAISLLAAVVSNFMWNRYWTYPDSRTKSFRRQFVQFTLVNLIGLAIRWPFVIVTHDFITEAVHQVTNLDYPLSSALGDNLTLGVAVVVVMFWNFFINRYWTYNDVD